MAAADLAHRGDLEDHKACETSLRTLPYATTCGFRDFGWEGGALHVLVSFSSTIQKTEAEGAGRYSARACADFTVDYHDRLSSRPLAFVAAIPAFVLSNNRERSQSAQGANARCGIKPRSCQGAESYLALARHAHNFSQVSGRRKPQPKKPKCPADRTYSPVVGRLIYRNRALS
ncbi:hypothetical protein [Arthrobacter sp. ISL-69]|uniref:hypothetical protein n=1 Tax=Arthrobacter sp. ISL-69 TaxID=2819113 RepID=UPI001BE7D940|nr:hypothetical protein [Arthrobacter sp. ISL-69]MBT2538531.1 hypothetical protein [Arthrobacter sp. ISL-69]